jgi:hypothetical protein
VFSSDNRDSFWGARRVNEGEIFGIAILCA